MATIRSNWTWPREGLTIDPVARLLGKTLLNLLLTRPLLLVLAYLPTASSPLPPYLKWLTIVGTFLSANDILTQGFNNNWTRDPWDDWAQELVVITGGSSGIGASIVLQLISCNPRTKIVIIDHSPLAFKQPLDSHMHFYQCDLSSSEAVKEVCARIRSEVGALTAFINNAGLTRGFTVMEGSYADVDLTMRTNLVAPFLLLKEFLPEMVRKNHGHIVNMSSMSALIPPAGLADYAASKAGLVALHERIWALALELQDRQKAPRVRLSLAVLSFVKTLMFKGRTNQSHFLTPLMHVDTVGEAVVDTLYSGYGRTTYLPGIMRYVASVRGAPEWFQQIMRDGTRRLGVDYRGRQVIEPKTGLLSE